MEFNEPGLEDLIQNDLHTEMNKILDQSETDCHNTDESLNSALQIPPLLTDDKTTDSTNDLCTDSKNSLGTDTVVTQPSSVSQDPINVIQSIKKESDSKNEMLLFEEYASKEEAENLDQATFSGHFSFEKLPANDDAIRQEHCQTMPHEANDLSNLAWLTGVEVQKICDKCLNATKTLKNINSLYNQSSANYPCHEIGMLKELERQTLQPNEMDSAIATSMVERAAEHLPCIPEPNHPFPTGASMDCSSYKPQMDVHGQVVKKHSMRFTPIQPNVSYEDCQRYQLHQGEPIHRRLLPSDHRLGMQRSYHPYPPPPYGSSNPSFIPNSYRHNRLHSQAKKVFPKPVYSYSCLIAMSLRASKTGCLPVSDIYNFMMENFPYFKTAPDGWKNSVRHNLSLNKCFEKVEKPNGSQRKGCLWALNPAKVNKMEEEVQKWKRKDPEAIRRSMSNPEELDRELEEIRRVDEEAARRRMLTTHGMSMLTPPSGYNLYARPHLHHQQHPNLHPSGTASLPTTPQHYHHQHTSQRTPLMHAMDDHTRHHPRQLFNYSVDPHNFQDHPAILGNRSSSSIISGHTHLQDASSNLLSSSSCSSGSFLGTLADTITKSVGDLNDIDLDASLADLSAFQGSLWDESESGLSSHPLVSDTFDEILPQSHPQLHPSSITSSSSSIGAMEQCASTDESVADSSLFSPAARFPADMSYLNGSGKAVALH